MFSIGKSIITTLPTVLLILPNRGQVRPGVVPSHRHGRPGRLGARQEQDLLAAALIHHHHHHPAPPAPRHAHLAVWYGLYDAVIHCVDCRDVPL